MITIIQRIGISYEKEGTLVKAVIVPGEYDSIPTPLKKSKNFMHYIKSVYPQGHPSAGEPNYVKGYTPTAAETSGYKPLKKKDSTVKTEIITPKNPTGKKGVKDTNKKDGKKPSSSSRNTAG